MSLKTNVLQELAKKKLAELQAKSNTTNENLYEFFGRVSPDWLNPTHLDPIVKRLENVEKEELQLAFSVPPRFGKTEILSHLIARFLIRNPGLTAAYCSYNAEFAQEKSANIQRYFLEGGGKLNPHKKGTARWLTEKGGGLIAVGIGGPLTGRGANLMIVDDPIKNRSEAESAVVRNNVFAWMTSTVTTRLQPKASYIVLHTRWHADDPIGRLATGQYGDWEYINLPAITEDGESLWPEFWSLDDLNKKKLAVGNYDWSALYMGSPRPRGCGVLNGINLYRYPDDKDPSHADKAPTVLPRIIDTCIGIDVAYTSKSYSDYSVAVVMGRGDDGKFYVLDVVRMQSEPPQFASRVVQLKQAYGARTVFWFLSGVEKGILSFMKNAGLYVQSEVTNKDKFVRAIETSAAWNRGDILLPISAPWLDTFTSEVLAFTGVNDAKDDQVDALVAAYHLLGAKHTVRGVGTNRIFSF